MGQIESRNIRSTKWLWIFTWRTLSIIIYVNPASFNPSTGEVNAEFGSTTDSEFQAAIEYAKTAQGNWAATTPMDRSDILRRAADLLDKYREDLAYVEVMDIGKPIIEARLDVQTGIDALKYCGGVSMALLGGETQSVTELRIQLKKISDSGIFQRQH